ncbi:helix-turn-helix domain-containing protein [Salinicola endophyticus]|uniref:Helix-turn-helix domain-containing protein n=1 Tax=Salinicola endophyticus TaxID=1949083 RepID=A0AB74U9N1_9GAMM
MDKLLWTPDEIEAAALIPYSAETIRRLVRRGEIAARKHPGRRVLIHYRDLEAYAERFRGSHNDAVAGPHASDGEIDVCRERQKKVSTKEMTRRAGGRASPTQKGDELGALLGYR